MLPEIRLFTAVMGIISAVVILASTNGHFWAHILWPPGVPFLVKVILMSVELAGVLIIKPAALIIRLFANMVAGHIIILSFISLIFIFGAMNKGAGWGFSPVSILFTVFIYFIGFWWRLSGLYFYQFNSGIYRPGI